ncbi:hemerythrin domain-containing protein [Dietzia sp. ANT_WB102]|uniref:hemerythrin domain-containing protein n=1 Tax=Dietzia sp. ANT_WB102 TaxID=2597345 RepID=UPI0011F0198D|nr:hemerythrin domain-containing protein [Dietzia sp. ANT_WB102]KAA0917868.1 hemerythrin domain-containing protein [Dietzia sp. ANT_WB102]
MTDTSGVTVGQLLERDHRRIDEGFERFSGSLAGPTADLAAFEDAARALRHHIYVEEVYHFPVVRASGLMAPVLVMLREHGEIWDLLDAITEALDRDDVATASSHWPRLANVLEQHNAKEERIVYPAGDQQLPTQIASTITAALATRETPSGWTCEMAGRRAPGDS